MTCVLRDVVFKGRIFFVRLFNAVCGANLAKRTQMPSGKGGEIVCFSTAKPLT